MPITSLLSELWRRRYFVLAGVVLVVASAGTFVATRDAVYEARATIAFLPDAENTQLVPFYGQAVESLLPTYARLVESRAFQDDVAADLPFPATGEDIARSVFIDPVPDIGVLEIASQSTSPARAQAFAQAVAVAFVGDFAANGIVTVRLIDPARLPVEPVSPSPSLIIVVAALVGALGGIGAALAWDRTFRKVETVRDLGEASDLNVLGSFPEDPSLEGARRLIVGDPARVELDESVRALRTNVLFAVERYQQGALLVTGLNPEDGKSTVTANLAVAVAELGFSVVLIDGDIHRPVQHHIFDLSNDAGLTSTILDGAEPSTLLQETKHEGVQVVPAGRSLESRAQEVALYLKHLPRFGTLGEIVLVDSPPLRAAEDVRLLAAFSGSVLLLVRAGRSTPAQVRGAVESLRMLEASVLGTVLTMAPRDAFSRSGEYYGYRKKAGYGTPPTGSIVQPPSAS